MKRNPPPLYYFLVVIWIYGFIIGIQANHHHYHTHHSSANNRHVSEHPWIPPHGEADIGLSLRPQYQDLEKAFQFIHKIQNPANCTVYNSKVANFGKYYIKMSMGINGGFAAQFQYGAAEFMRLLHASNFEYPIVIDGQFRGYSNNEKCKDWNHEWLCYFMEPSSCHHELLKSGTEVSFSTPNIPDEHIVPEQFKSNGLPFWWGAIQYYLFQMRPFVLDHIHFESSHMSNGKGFPFYMPVAGMHVRHGDKHTDGFQEHSLHEELGYIRKSSECMVMNSRSDCFTYLNTSDPINSLVWLTKAAKGYGMMMKAQDVDQFNSSLGWWHPANMQLAVETKTIHGLISKIHSGGFHHQDHAWQRQIDNATDQFSGNRSFHLHHTNLLKNSNAKYVFPVQLFVASDDPSVVSTAERLGFLTDSAGVSQHTSTAGMWNTLTHHPELGYNATLEIITDIYYLSHSSTLLGICASQVFRMAVALSNVTGILQYVKAMDMNQIGRVKQLSNKYRVPFPENFER
jgi:hypothetical protein